MIAEEFDRSAGTDAKRAKHASARRAPGHQCWRQATNLGLSCLLPSDTHGLRNRKGQPHRVTLEQPHALLLEVMVLWLVLPAVSVAVAV